MNDSGTINTIVFEVLVLETEQEVKNANATNVKNSMFYSSSLIDFLLVWLFGSPRFFCGFWSPLLKVRNNEMNPHRSLFQCKDLKSFLKKQENHELLYGFFINLGDK